MRNKLLAFCAAATLAGAPAFADVFGNGDFETGNFNGWTEKGGLWYGYQKPDPSGPNYPADYTFGNAPYQSAIVTPGNIAVLGAANIPQVYSGNYAARINSNDGGSFHFSQIEQTAKNWSASYLYFAWNAVLQEPGHPHKEEPHFIIRLDDLTTGQNLLNTFYASDNLPPALLKTQGQYKYTDWQQAQLDTSKVTGHDLKLTILAADCGQGAHNGALFVDEISSQALGINALPVAVPQANPTTINPGDLVKLDGTASYDAENDPLDMYEWDANNDGTAELTGALVDFTVPLGWGPGDHNVRLRVHETPTDALPQWSNWASVKLTIPGGGGGDPNPTIPLPAGVWGGLGLLSLVAGKLRRRHA